MNARLQGKVAIVTGASRGIGAAIAQRFAAEGAHVVMCARTKDALEQTARQIESRGGRVKAVVLDVADHEALAQFVRSTAAEHGRLDVLVNNAPSVTYAAIPDMDVATFRKDFQVNVDSTFVATREALAVMIPQKRGSIINIASINGVLACAGMSAYGAAKAAMIQFTRYTAIEAAPHNVRANVIVPGVINTPATAAGFAGPNAEWGKKIAAQVPMKRFGEPEEVANLALFLASDESSYITAASIPIDGGRSAELVIPPP